MERVVVVFVVVVVVVLPPETLLLGARIERQMNPVFITLSP